MVVIGKYLQIIIWDSLTRRAPMACCHDVIITYHDAGMQPVSVKTMPIRAYDVHPAISYLIRQSSACAVSLSPFRTVPWAVTAPHSVTRSRIVIPLTIMKSRRFIGADSISDNEKIGTDNHMLPNWPHFRHIAANTHCVDRIRSDRPVRSEFSARVEHFITGHIYAPVMESFFRPLYRQDPRGEIPPINSKSITFADNISP